MRTKSKMVVAAVLLSFSLIALSLMTAGVQAKALKLSFEYRCGPLNFGELEKQWVSDGVVHYRGWVATQTISKETAMAVETDCDLTFYGDLEFVINMNYFTKTGERTGWGTWMKDGTFLKKEDGVWEPYLTGVVEGTFSLRRRGERTAQGIGWGTEGDLVGMKIERFSHYVVGGLVFGGTLLNPHG